MIGSLASSASIRRAIGMARRAATPSSPNPRRAIHARVRASAWPGPLACTCCPLMVAAAWNRPRAAGIAISVAILAPPPDWPKTITREGSPPNAAM